jgi:murein L,D-transpeptidase YafK
MRRAGPLLLIAVAGCSAPQAEQVAPSQAAYLPPPPAETYEADYILVDKSERTLTLYSHGIAIERYTGLQLGGEPVGAKHFEGDQRTPEGWYTIDYRNPRSAYHLSLHISYPTPAQSGFAARYGRSAGGEIFIHGQPNALAAGREPGDWTDGCIALSDAEIETLWREVPDGTPIEIRP